MWKMFLLLTAAITSRFTATCPTVSQSACSPNRSHSACGGHASCSPITQLSGRGTGAPSIASTGAQPRRITATAPGSRASPKCHSATRRLPPARWRARDGAAAAAARREAFAVEHAQRGARARRVVCRRHHLLGEQVRLDAGAVVCCSSLLSLLAWSRRWCFSLRTSSMLWWVAASAKRLGESGGRISDCAIRDHPITASSTEPTRPRPPPRPPAATASTSASR